MIPNRRLLLVTENNISTCLGLLDKHNWNNDKKMVAFSKFETSKEHCVKSVRIPSFSCPYSVKMREHVDQKTYEYGHFHAVILIQNFSNLENSTLQIITHSKTVFPGDGATKEMLKTDVRS